MTIGVPHFYYTTMNIRFFFRQHTKKNVGFPFYLTELIDNSYLFHPTKLIDNLFLFHSVMSMKVGPFLPIQYMNISASRV